MGDAANHGLHARAFPRHSGHNAHLNLASRRVGGSPSAAITTSCSLAPQAHVGMRIAPFPGAMKRLIPSTAYVRTPYTAPDPPFTLPMPFRFSRMILSTMLCNHRKPPAISCLHCWMPRRLASLSTWGREAMASYLKSFSGRQASASKRFYGANSRIHELFFATLTARLIQAATDAKLRFRVEMVSGSVLVVLAQLHVS